MWGSVVQMSSFGADLVPMGTLRQEQAQILGQDQCGAQGPRAASSVGEEEGQKGAESPAKTSLLFLYLCPVVGPKFIFGDLSWITVSRNVFFF